MFVGKERPTLGFP